MQKYLWDRERSKIDRMEGRVEIKDKEKREKKREERRPK